MEFKFFIPFCHSFVMQKLVKPLQSKIIIHLQKEKIIRRFVTAFSDRINIFTYFDVKMFVTKNSVC